MTLRASVDRTYIAIDLKSFYASVECVARGLDPLKSRPTYYKSCGGRSNKNRKNNLSCCFTCS